MPGRLSAVVFVAAAALAGQAAIAVRAFGTATARQERVDAGREHRGEAREREVDAGKAHPAGQRVGPVEAAPRRRSASARRDG